MVMVYVILANGFEEIEALTPVDVLRRAGLEVVTVGIGGKTVMGAHGIGVVCDKTYDELDEELTGADMLVFPGGMPGASNIDSFRLTDKYIGAVLGRGGFVAAVCASPMILGKRGYLRGKRAVCFPGFEEYLLDAVVEEGADVARDGNIITSRCMGTALPFALELVECLLGKDVRDKTEKAVMAL